MGRNYRHLSWNDRLVIERMLRKGYHKTDIANAIGCCLKTVYNEINRAEYEHTNSDLTTEIRYSPDIAHEKYLKGLKKKGVKAKLTKDKRLSAYIEKMIIEDKYSPRAVLLHIKNYNLSFIEKISSVNTIYDGIKKGYFKNLELEYLPRKGKRIKHKKKIKIQSRVSQGTSIEKRSEEINKRETFGHWEMDCVVGAIHNKKAMLVLTERKTRYEIIEQLKKHTNAEVIKALNRMEKRYKKYFYKIFQSITVDNGHEFSDAEGMGKALCRAGNRTKIYYCHPYCPHERGSNENQNLFIRRFLPKGSDFDKELNRNKVKDIEYWINTYPRELLEGRCSLDLFDKEIKEIEFNCRI